MTIDDKQRIVCRPYAKSNSLVEACAELCTTRELHIALRYWILFRRAPSPSSRAEESGREYRVQILSLTQIVWSS